ncbi:MAG: hypothetical protein AAGJ32_04430 [Pseudomonadota bacterium]
MTATDPTCQEIESRQQRPSETGSQTDEIVEKLTHVVEGLNNHLEIATLATHKRLAEIRDDLSDLEGDDSLDANRGRQIAEGGARNFMLAVLREGLMLATAGVVGNAAYNVTPFITGYADDLLALADSLRLSEPAKSIIRFIVRRAP